VHSEAPQCIWAFDEVFQVHLSWLWLKHKSTKQVCDGVGELQPGDGECRQEYNELEMSYKEMQSIFNPNVQENLDLIQQHLVDAGGKVQEQNCFISALYPQMSV
jgi:hypothetical protein